MSSSKLKKSINGEIVIEDIRKKNILTCNYVCHIQI